MTSLIYNTGTVALENGSATVTGSGTGWAVALVTGGLFSCAGMAIPIASVENDTSLTLAYAWTGGDASGAAYAIARDTSEAVRAAWTNDRLATIIQRLSLVGIHPDGSGTLTERDALDPVPATGYLWLYAESGHDFAFYRKTASGWDGPFEVKGEAGSDSTVPGPAGEGFNPAGAWVIGTTYSQNDFVSYSGRSFVSLADGNVGHAPPTSDADNTYWQFVPAAKGDKGDKGDDGDQGPKGDTGDPGSTGATGPANTLSIGTVTQGSAGASITGSAPNQTLNLTLPKGDTGSGSVDSVNGDHGPDITLTQDDVGDGTTYKQYSATEKTKLSGIASGATANSSDATLKARANHTGTQAASTISDFSTAADARISAAIGTTAGTVAAGDDSRIVGAFQAANVIDEDDMSSDSDTKVPTQQSVKAYADSGDARQIGVGQTWQDVKSSRAPGTSYQNTMGRPIAVVVQYKSSVVAKAFQVSSSGSAWINLSDTDSSTKIVVSIIVPAGWYYRLESSTTVYYWAELK